MTQQVRDDEYVSSRRRRVRLIALLSASEGAGIAPLPILRLHALAYLSNVLAPVWNLRALDGKVLKRLGGPFYPALQHDLDSLVGLGVAKVTKVGHVRDETNRWRLEGSYALNEHFSAPILGYIREDYGEARKLTFIEELAFAFSALTDEQMDSAISQDATYSDPVVSAGNIIDFAEWRTLNYSSNAAREFARLNTEGPILTSGEMINLYVRHMYRRMHGEQ